MVGLRRHRRLGAAPQRYIGRPAQRLPLVHGAPRGRRLHRRQRRRLRRCAADRSRCVAARGRRVPGGRHRPGAARRQPRRRADPNPGRRGLVVPRLAQRRAHRLARHRGCGRRRAVVASQRRDGRRDDVDARRCHRDRRRRRDPHRRRGRRRHGATRRQSDHGGAGATRHDGAGARYLRQRRRGPAVRPAALRPRPCRAAVREPVRRAHGVAAGQRPGAADQDVHARRLGSGRREHVPTRLQARPRPAGSGCRAGPVQRHGAGHRR